MKHKTEKDIDDHSGNNVIEPKSEPGTPTAEVLILATEYVAFELKYEEARKKSSELYKELVRLEARLYDRMMGLPLESFRHPEFGLISCRNRVDGKIIDFDAASNWLKTNGLFDEIFKYKEKKVRVNELLKQYLEDGKSIPPGFDYVVVKSIGHTSA